MIKLCSYDKVDIYTPSDHNMYNKQYVQKVQSDYYLLNRSFNHWLK